MSFICKGSPIFCSNNVQTFFEGDRVIFAENPTNPGVPLVYRTPEEKSANPDRLNLDRYLIGYYYVDMCTAILKHR